MRNDTKDFPLRKTAVRSQAREAGGHEPTVLTTWKEVARYMGKGVRTVQRWERNFGLPVRRPPGSRHRRAVLAMTSDLDAWVALSCSRVQRGRIGEPCSEIALTLREQIRAANELRIANRLLLNEIHIAAEALRQSLRAMCPPSPANDHDGVGDRRVRGKTLPN